MTHDDVFDETHVPTPLEEGGSLKAGVVRRPLVRRLMYSLRVGPASFAVWRYALAADGVRRRSTPTEWGSRG